MHKSVDTWWSSLGHRMHSDYSELPSGENRCPSFLVIANDQTDGASSAVRQTARCLMRMPRPCGIFDFSWFVAMTDAVASGALADFSQETSFFLLCPT